LRRISSSPSATSTRSRTPNPGTTERAHTGRQAMTSTRGSGPLRPGRQRSIAERLGFRRLEMIHVVVDDDGQRAYARGVSHRLPRTVPIPTALATEAIASGVPVRTVDRRR